jgi:endonuclease YncB( thermonuclease family)
MFLRGRRFALPAAGAVFATGVVLGSALGPNWPGRPATAIAAAPGTGAPALFADTTTRYPVEVVRVIDGDTFEARVRVWPAIEIATKVRLRNIDAPEMRGRCGEEFAMAQAARDALAAMLADGPVTIAQVATDKYGGRVLADAATRRVSDVGAALLEAGLVRRYSGGRREPWC